MPFRAARRRALAGATPRCFRPLLSCGARRVWWRAAARGSGCAKRSPCGTATRCVPASVGRITCGAVPVEASPAAGGGSAELERCCLPAAAHAGVFADSLLVLARGGAVALPGAAAGHRRGGRARCRAAATRPAWRRAAAAVGGVAHPRAGANGARPRNRSADRMHLRALHPGADSAADIAAAAGVGGRAVRAGGCSCGAPRQPATASSAHWPHLGGRRERVWQREHVSGEHAAWDSNTRW